MSHSRRKHPICGITMARSEKFDKQRRNRRLRVAERPAVAHLAALGTSDEEAVVEPVIQEMPRTWGAKDGRQRFDPACWPELMRK